MTLLDNTQYIKESKLHHQIPEELPNSSAGFVDWSQYFGNSHPVELEIGTGRTHYLFERASIAPDRNLIGIEWKAKWVTQAQKKIAREGIQNVYIMHANAWVMAPKLLDPESIVNVTFHFPDPWWKKRHHKRRILNDEFTNIIVSKLKPGGTIFVQSDVKPLAEEYLGVLDNHPKLINKAGSGKFYPDNPMHAQSHREKKVIENGLPVYRMLFEKVD